MSSTPDPVDVTVGARIRVRRLQLGLSQVALGDHLGVSFQQIQKYERGHNRISASMLVRAAEKLRISVAELVGETADSIAEERLLGMLAFPGALDVLESFCAVPDSRVRGAVLDLLRATRSQGGDRGAGDRARGGRRALRSRRQADTGSGGSATRVPGGGAWRSGT